ncbi:hypothetical protein HGM15179_001611 [Zosterops borbonicus]|uniref:Uncharacterized protein n=1 Tax=Zosterops borbonicus TaxID=364589 RepID=A0A8K1GWX7_9PASS|nr:hypothetical protein HGM15179_001611 [Zosterops borbonicus]
MKSNGRKLNHERFHLNMSHRITEWIWLEGTAVGCLVQSPILAGLSQRTWHRIVSRWFVNISSEGHPTSSLGNLYRCGFTHTAQKLFLMFWWNFLGINFCPLPLVLLPDTTEQRLDPSS